MAKKIMIQGTMSNAGKSIIAAGLCRIFRQDGYKAAPFKSQNMALNSYITDEGLEMGRAQVMQAEAAMTVPSVLMNPILLKPVSDMGSQVIVNGIPRENMSARDYFAYKQSLVPDILYAYRELERRYDIIVIEGAGSPAEINLKADDIVNMGLADMLDAPVLLAGDIDRGGVFAQLVGTLMLLEPAERRRVKGLIINKFRGDKTILDPGIEMLKAYTDIPVVGVVPYMQIDVDDEDSLSDRLEGRENDELGILDIAVIRLPKLSNFTDFNSLSRLKGITLRYVDDIKKFKDPDLIIIPGTKNTISDLKWLRMSGLEALIMKKHSEGKLIMGICGGYQMLGHEISDPENAEGGGSISGLGLLPLRTEFSQDKVRLQVSTQTGKVTGAFESLSYIKIEGYEIHMGKTYPLDGSTEIPEILSARGNVCGSFVHGFFDTVQMQKAIIKALLKNKGIDDIALDTIDDREYKQRQYDILADTLREHLDMKMIYGILK